MKTNVIHITSDSESGVYELDLLDFNGNESEYMQILYDP